MNRSWFKACLALMAVALAISAPMCAQQATFALDPDKTIVSFSLGASFHTVHGSFHVKSGSIRFDPSTGAASGAVVVDAASGQTGNAKRDRNMHRDVLQSARYPEITFTPTRVNGSVLQQGESPVQVEGILRLEETDHTVTLHFQVQATENGDLRAATQFVVPYVAWGLKNPSSFLLRVADTVEMSIVAIGKVTTSAPKP